MPSLKFAGAAALALALMTSACVSEGAASLPDYAAVVADAARPADDVARDAGRHPAAILEITGIAPGDKVLELEAGAGYFTELLSRTVGPDGQVWMQNPASFDGFLGDTVTKRLEGRLTNVTYLKSNFDALGLPDASMDAVTWFQGPHELWYIPEGTTESLGDPEESFAEIARVLKPGGVFIAIDHTAPAGSPPTTGGDTHRIDPALIRQMAEAAGLSFRESSDILRNPDDDGLTNVFDPAIRGKTDQAVLVFTRP
ncbi:methyltransferase domain-containing protein [Hyphomonas sp. WL0036]|uniref:methyltransferase domain-containing protein n=1 Tax=Hyphomonas sediminis TaxID=2866160 RepID=UPI001C7F4D00|nr:methyltransferase domain-containing protein [Hyphomonas sediminis]MBY9065862.1 methyltransferase domain-containing protein [Hyphomonas sediminis]